MNVWTMITPWVSQGFRDIMRTVVGPWLIAHGVANASNEQALLGAFITIAGVLWGWWTTSGAKQVGGLLQKLTATNTHAAAIEVAKIMPPATVTGAADQAKDVASAAGVLKILLLAFLVTALVAPCAFAQSGTLRPLKPVAAKTSATSATAPAAAAVNPLQSFLDQVNKKAAAINAFTLADAQAAMTMAANDPVGLSCYTAIAAKLQANGAVSLIPQSLGLLQLIEAARLAKLQASAIATGVDPVVSGCAGLILDANTTLLMLEGQGAVGALTAVGLP